MIYNIAIVLVLVTLASAQATVCTTDAECMSGECCYIKTDFLVGRRDGQPMLMPRDASGVCEQYHALHDPCNPLDTSTGHCGCPVNMTCAFVPDNPVTLTNDLVSGTLQCELK